MPTTLRKTAIAALTAAFVLPMAAQLSAGAAAKAPTPGTLSISTTEFKFSGVPATLKAGRNQITLRNTGKLPHSFQLVRIDGTHSDKEVIENINSADDAPIPAWAIFPGGLGSIAPGAREMATVNLEPGNYWYFSHSNGDDNIKERDSSKGMIGKLAVTGKAGVEPSASVTIIARDYTYSVPKLTSGRHEIAFRNDGKEIHHLVYAKLAATKTVADAKAFFASQNPPPGPPPIDFSTARDLAAIDPGKALVTTVDLAKGNYVFMCFFPDRTGGAPHASKGMITQVDIA